MNNTDAALLEIDNRPGTLENLSREELIALVKEKDEEIKFKIEEIQQLETQLYIDDLTKLHTKTYYEKETRPKIEKHIKMRSEAIGRRNEMILVGMVDMDNLKKINDAKGHAAGDDALVKIAGILREVTRDTDTIFRSGNKADEFGIVMFLPPLPDWEDFADTLKVRCRQHLLERTNGVADISMEFINIDEVSLGENGDPMIAEDGSRNYKYVSAAEALHAADIKMIKNKKFRKDILNADMHS